MAEPTTTRQVLRRELGVMANMPFYNKFSDGYVPLTGTPTTTKLSSSDRLVQEDNTWTNSYVYIVDGVCAGESRLITGHTRQDGTLILEYPLPSAPSASDTIEITGRWSPEALHKALNFGIRDGQKAYPDTEVDETIIIQEKVLEYDLTSMTRIPWQIRQIYLEEGSQYSYTGTATAGASDYLDTTLEFSPSDISGYHLSIYDGTGAGQLRTIDTYTASTGRIVPTEDFTTSPATDSKFRVWSSSEQLMPWTPLTTVKIDQEEFPTKLWIDSGLDSWNGYRLRIVHLSLPLALSSDTDETAVPRDFVCHKALSYLHDRMIGLTSADKALHGDASELHDQIAELYKQKNPRRAIPAMMIQKMSGYPSTLSDTGNPLGW